MEPLYIMIGSAPTEATCQEEDVEFQVHRNQYSPWALLLNTPSIPVTKWAEYCGYHVATTFPFVTTRVPTRLYCGFIKPVIGSVAEIDQYVGSQKRHGNGLNVPQKSCVVLSVKVCKYLLKARA